LKQSPDREGRKFRMRAKRNADNELLQAGALAHGLVNAEQIRGKKSAYEPWLQARTIRTVLRTWFRRTARLALTLTVQGTWDVILSRYLRRAKDDAGDADNQPAGTGLGVHGV